MFFHKIQRSEVRHYLIKFLNLWEHPLGGFVGSFIVFGFLAWYNGSFLARSHYPYFNYLADAFLHGQLHLRLQPPITLDLAFYNNKHYLYWPPFPAILMMPFVYMFGVEFFDIPYSIVIASLGVAVVALLFREVSKQSLIEVTRYQRSMLVLFYALGTSVVTIAPFGRVWDNSILTSLLLVALAYFFTIRLYGPKAFLLTGFALACATLTRNHVLFTGVWPAIYLLYKHKKFDRFRLFVWSTLGCLPIITGIILFSIYNYSRFGNVFDVGLAYHEMADFFIDNFKNYGVFNIHYVPTNIFYQYIAYPFPYTNNSVMGGSLFLLSPVFLLSFIGIKVGRPRWSTIALLITICLVNIPILLLMGTGWVQISPRYTLDFTIPLLLLTAIGVRKCPDLRLGLLSLISIAHNILAAILLTYIFP